MWQIPLNTKSKQPLHGSRVDWLWASKENGETDFNISELIDTLTLPKNISATDKYIKFRVGTSFGRYTKGNVILALRDASGEIVWTWHIWITDEPQEVAGFLDRNIGALSAEPGPTLTDNFGFVYQWGRKDPFFGGDGIANETTPLALANEHTIRNTGVTWDSIKTTQSTDYARRNPTTFICNPASSATLTADWLSSSNPNRWSDSEKTDHDPCPDGYKVPSRDDLEVLQDAANEVSPYSTFQPAGLWHWEYTISMPFQGTFTTIWPAAGMRQGRLAGKLTGSGTAAARGQCIYWTSTPVNISGIPPGGSYHIFTSGVLLYSRDDFGDNADAYPVRCVKIP